MVLAEQTQIQIPTNLDWIEPTAEYLKNKALLCGSCEEAQAGRLLLALHEALTNSIVHGNLGVSSALKEEDNNNFARLLAEKGQDLYRMKGVLSLRGDPNRFIFQGVHMTLDTTVGTEWGKAPRVNKLIFIGKDLDRAALNAGFQACLA